MQYFTYIYNYVKEWLKNPKWSLSCCLALLLPLNDLQGEIRGLTGRNMLKQQLQTGRMEMPSIANTLRDSGAVNITLEDDDDDDDDDAEREQEEEITNDVDLKQGLLSLAGVSIFQLPWRRTQDTRR